MVKPPRDFEIDLSRVGSERDVHDAFASSLPFPQGYGQNCDAFYDVLCGFDCFPRRLILVGRDHVQRVVPRAFEKLQTCFTDCEREYPEIAPSVTWR